MIRTSMGTISFEMHDQIQRLESDHEIGKRPTVKFLEELAALLAYRWGKATMTVSQAWQAWIAIDECVTVAMNKQRPVDELSFWYGFDCSDLDPIKLAAMRANLPAMKAQKTIHDGNFDPVNYESVFNLFMLATGNRNTALNARSQSIKAGMKSNV